MLAVSIIELEKKEYHAHAHRLLRECLKPFGVDYNESTPVKFVGRGKPCLADYPEVHYNISHSDGICACIASENECGIDCERVKPFHRKVLRRVLSESEKSFFEGTPEDEQELLFFRLWTLKEAYIKATGIGLAFPMSKAEFHFDGEKIVTNVEGYDFRQYIIGGKYVVSVCERCDNSNI